MFIEKEVQIYDFVSVISEAADLVSPVLNSHQSKVAYISYRIAKRMKLASDDIEDIVLAAMLHDIGEFSTEERIKAFVYDSFDNELSEPALLGYKLLENFTPLANAAQLIKYHHCDYEKLRTDIPIGSSIIHLADKVCVLLNERREILAQVPEVLDKIIQKHRKFHPDTIAALLYLARFDYFWLELSTPLTTFRFNTLSLKQALSSKKISNLETLKDFAKIVAKIIDFRSRYTAAHSHGVAAVVNELAVISGFSERECKRMEIAGLLHDLGKFSVPNDILEKNGKLDNEEINVIRKHPYYTYAALSKIDGMEDMAPWAAYHHERQDGNGYPFHVNGEDFPKLARFMAVADILTALTEDRPYRPGMDVGEAMGILFSMAKNGGVDKSIVELADRYFLPVNDARIKAQHEVLEEYGSLNNLIDSIRRKEVLQPV